MKRRVKLIATFFVCCIVAVMAGIFLYWSVMNLYHKSQQEQCEEFRLDEDARYWNTLRETRAKENDIYAWSYYSSESNTGGIVRAVVIIFVGAVMIFSTGTAVLCIVEPLTRKKRLRKIVMKRKQKNQQVAMAVRKALLAEGVSAQELRKL